MTCPSSESLLGFAAGQLTDDQSALVEAHIDGCSDCRATLSSLARGDIPPTFGRYRLDTVLGSGGMGIVYRAWDPQLARSVAIKVVRSAGDDASVRARLVREAQALAKVSHPNVCHVYDVGTDGEEVWVAMELIDGVTLRQWAGERRDPAEVIGALLGAAEGIAAAHAAGIIHRDVKPENVLMTRDGRAVVTDFGLARAHDTVDPVGSTQALPLAETVAETDSPNPHLTATGAIIGTPAYLAPEQLTGEPVDARIDQFTWAVMAWELITGVRPFPIVFASRLDAIRAGVTPPPTMTRPIALALARALQVAPRDRFPSMRELIGAMRAEAPTARVSNRSGVVAAIVGASVLVAGAIVITAWPRPPSQFVTTTIADRDGLNSRNSGSSTSEVADRDGLNSRNSGSAELKQFKPSPSTPSPSTPEVADRDGLNSRNSGSAELKQFKPSPSVETRPSSPTTAKSLAITARNASLPPAPRRPQPAAIVATQSQYPPSNAANSLDPPLARGNAIASMDAFCHIPYDAAHPDPKTATPIADWGRVTSTQREVGRIGDREVALDIDEVAGARGKYRIKDDLGVLGRLYARVGDLLVVCPDDESSVYQLTGGPTTRTLSVVPVSAPPRIIEVASYKPLHVSSVALLRDAAAGKIGLDPDRRYLIHAKVEGAEGSLWDMGRWSLEVAGGARGADLVSSGKQLWFVIEKPEFQPRGGDKPRLVVHAIAVLAELFP